AFPLAKPPDLWIRLPFVVWSTLVAVAAVGLSWRSMFVRVASRGVLWLILLAAANQPLAAPRLLEYYLWGVGAGGGPCLSRASLEGEQARRAFAPVAYRRLLLGGAVASTAMATMVGLCALHFLLTATWYDHSMVFGGTALGALAIAFVMSAHGVLRLRAWGL